MRKLQVQVETVLERVRAYIGKNLVHADLLVRLQEPYQKGKVKERAVGMKSFSTRHLALRSVIFMFNARRTISSEASRLADSSYSPALDSRYLRKNGWLSVSYFYTPGRKASAMVESRYSGLTQNLRLTGRIGSLGENPITVSCCASLVNSLQYWSYLQTETQDDSAPMEVRCGGWADVAKKVPTARVLMASEMNLIYQKLD